jgi:hypothetical protein
MMFDGVPRNQAFDAPGAGRSLSADDRAKIRRLYGAGFAVENCCVKVKSRINAVAGISGNLQLWIQDARTGALAEVDITRPNKFADFSNLPRGGYEIIAQSYSNSSLPTEAVHFGVRELITDHSFTVNASGSQTSFDISFVGVGELSKRAIRAEPGNSYRVIIAGPGLNNPELQFATTSKKMLLLPIKEEAWTNKNGIVFRAFQLTVPASVPAGQYSLFVQDGSGARRYLVGGLAVN